MSHEFYCSEEFFNDLQRLYFEIKEKTGIRSSNITVFTNKMVYSRLHVSKDGSEAVVLLSDIGYKDFYEYFGSTKYLGIEYIELGDVLNYCSLRTHLLGLFSKTGDYYGIQGIQINMEALICIVKKLKSTLDDFLCAVGEDNWQSCKLHKPLLDSLHSIFACSVVSRRIDLGSVVVCKFYMDGDDLCLGCVSSLNDTVRYRSFCYGDDYLLDICLEGFVKVINRFWKSVQDVYWLPKSDKPSSIYYKVNSNGEYTLVVC